jgi:type I restriction enzyme M protein
VELGVESKSGASIISMLAMACNRALIVRWQSIDFLASDFFSQTGFDHGLIAPPIGMRHKVGAGDSLSTTEMLGARWAAHIGRLRNVVVVGNGLLFRTSSKDAAFKQELLCNYGLEAVVSLPRGGWAGSAIAVSALVFSGREQRQPRHELRLIDASEPGSFDAHALRKLLSGEGRDSRCVDRSFEELTESGFNLSVGRYVLDTDSRRSRELLEGCKTVSLTDIADVRRPQALPRDPQNENWIMVREAQLADIRNGQLIPPSKFGRLPRSALPKIESATLRPGDILLSIKGTIGKTALVTGHVTGQSKLFPIVPGQSFVIIRLRQGSVIDDPQVLLGYLRSPVAQSLLQSISGGTRIANVAMGELKQMAVPIPSAEVQAKIVAEFDEWTKVQREIDELREKTKVMEENISRLVVGDNRRRRNANH